MPAPIPRALRLWPWSALLGAILALLSPGLQAQQDGNPWYQVELSIFTHEEGVGFDAERFAPDQLSLEFPARLRRLDTYYDLLSLSPVAVAPLGSLTAGEPAPLDPWIQWIEDTGPPPRVSPFNFLLPDVNRAAFLQLPDSLSDFRQTNRALERSADNRLLFHGLWRQPVQARNQATAILLEAGREYGGRYELEGSLTIHFNDSRDRVVMNANFWLTEFTTVPGDDSGAWVLPEIPARLARPASDAPAEPAYRISRIAQIRQSRDMRSNEFHYVDHPLVGVVVSIKPYQLPPPAVRIPVSAGP